MKMYIIRHRRHVERSRRPDEGFEAVQIVVDLRPPGGHQLDNLRYDSDHRYRRYLGPETVSNVSLAPPFVEIAELCYGRVDSSDDVSVRGAACVTREGGVTVAEDGGDTLKERAQRL